jgi:DNA-binding transcriptional ArsR family regulator
VDGPGLYCSAFGRTTLNQIGEKKKEILNLLADPHYTGMSQTQLGEILDIKQSSVSQHLEELEGLGLIDIDKSRNSNDIKELTREGYRTREKAVGNQEPIQEDSLNIELHNCQVKFKINNARDLDTAWVERAFQTDQVRHRYDPTNDSYLLFTDKWEFRVTSRHLFVKLKDMRGRDAHNLKNRALAQAFKARDWIQERSPLELYSRPADLEIWINRQHLSIIGHPFALLVDQFSNLELSDIKIYDSQGKERLWMDSSNGPELEAGNAPGENREYAEEDIQHLIEELEWKVQNKESSEKLRNIDDYEARIEALEERLNELEASESTTVSDELSISSKWRDRWGNVMGYSQDLDAPVKIYDKSEV